MAREISNFDDVIDSRDVIERIHELENLAEDAEYELDEAEENELSELRDLDAEARDYAPDWEYGETLIRDSYFETYAQELVECNSGGFTFRCCRRVS